MNMTMMMCQHDNATPSKLLSMPVGLALCVQPQ